MKRTRFVPIFLLPVVALGCLLAFALISLPLGLPNLAAETFGPPADSLGIVDQVYLSAVLLLYKGELTSPGDAVSREIPFQVALGESAGSVSSRLEEAGLLRNPAIFLDYLQYSGIDTQIQAGDYVLNSIMSPVDIAQVLQDPTPSQVDFVVLAGWRAEEIAAALPYSGLAISPEDFLAASRRNQAEGFLYPGAYAFDREISADFLVRTLMAAFEANLTEELKAGFEQQGLSVREAVTLASIVERESVLDEEMPLIASVFLNRLNIGMKLEADPTTQYAVGYNAAQGTWWTNPLSNADLGVDSPYNTYLYPGLPPGPIANPGANALRAVAFPAQTPYYYFRSACDNTGRHVFAVTFEEHLGNACP